MGINGEYMSLAEAVGEKEMTTAWIPGENYFPDEPGEMEVMELVWEKERYSRIAILEAENRRLRNELAEINGDDERDDDYWD